MRLFETAGCRVGRPGLRLRAVVLTELGWVGGGCLSSVMEECGAVSLGQGIPFHTRVRKRKNGSRGEGRAGWSWASPQTFGGRTLCSSGLFSIPRNSRLQLSPLRVTLLNKLLTNAI